MREESVSWTELLDSYRNRRGAVRAMAAAAGSVLLFRPDAGELDRQVSAQETDDDDNSGRGRGRGRGGDDHDNSGHGNADDEGDGEDAPVPVTGVIPEGAIEVQIISDDAGGFEPGELTVDLGQTVAFVNRHDDEHTATGSGFDTGIINPGEVATVVLDTPGTFAYACQIHPEMTGRIGVRGEDGVVPQAHSAPQDVPADATPVRIINLSFDPPEITVPTGAAVVWTNDDSVPHTVTSTDRSFDSGIFDPGASFSWTFDQPGSFPYACQLHPQMQGTVTAQGDAVVSSGEGSVSQSDNAPSSQAEVESPQATPSASPGEMPTGVWIISLTPDDESLIGAQQALVTFDRNGTVEADFMPAQGTTAASRLAFGRGAWIAKNGAARITLVTFVTDENEQFAGTAMIEGQGQLDAAARTIDGTFEFSIADSRGQTVGEGAGSMRGGAVPQQH